MFVLKIIEKIFVYVDGVKKNVFSSMLEALSYVHENCIGHKVTLKTEKEYVK